MPEEKSLPDVFGPFLERPSSSVCPIFRMVDSKPIQFGSGVFIQIGVEVYLLTAAHVTDEQDTFDLMIPGSMALIPLNGYHAGMRMPATGKREDDHYDIAYYRLLPELVINLHPSFIFLGPDDCALEDTTSDGDAYSMIGYPSSKAFLKGNAACSELLTLSGDGQSSVNFDDFNLKAEHHLVIRYRQKKGIHYSTLHRRMAPKPEGMSGGGVFAWDKQLSDPKRLAQPRLCAILIERHNAASYFVATRLSCYLNCIRHNHPDLPIVVKSSFAVHRNNAEQ